jgi:hypothetical protein
VVTVSGKTCTPLLPGLWPCAAKQGTGLEATEENVCVTARTQLGLLPLPLLTCHTDMQNQSWRNIHMSHPAAHPDPLLTASTTQRQQQAGQKQLLTQPR